MPCKNGVNIPGCFEFYNQAHIYDAKEQSGGIYAWALSGIFGGIPGFASCCLTCGECEEKCPQGLPVQKHLKEVAAYFGK
jgi:predicted aldo/keto reductase-like oxidoreductase